MKGCWLTRALVGGVAGLGATVPMTLAMALSRRWLPASERRPLPPRDVTKNVLRALGTGIDERSPHEQAAVALGAHLAFGTIAGAVYGPLAGRSRLSPVAEGAAYGLALWAGSYLGWLPATRLLGPATAHPPRRTAIMVAAHLVFGAALGVATGATTRGG